MSVVRIRNITDTDYIFGSKTISANSSYVMTKSEFFTTLAFNNLTDARTSLIIDDVSFNEISITDFGAVGDGLTDNTEAIQNAFDFIAKNGGGNIIVPPGVFITGDVTCSASVIIVGVGRESSYFKSTETIAVNGSTDITFKNLSFVGDETNNSVAFIGCTYINIYDCGFYNSNTAVNISGECSVLRIMGSNFIDTTNFLVGRENADTVILFGNNTGGNTIDGSDIETIVSEIIAGELIDINGDISDIMDDITSLQGQIDGQVITWFYDHVPNSTNEPEVNWLTTQEKDNHIADVFYNVTTGVGYRYAFYDNAYQWLEITDAKVLEALEAASNAQDTADSKRRIFVVEPTTPYDVGDLWLTDVANGGDINVCIVQRLSGLFDDADWSFASGYTDDSALDDFLDNTYAVDKEIWNAKGKTTYGDEPLVNNVGDIWVSITGQISTWDGDEWVPTVDSTKNRTFYDTEDSLILKPQTDPVPPANSGDIWYNTSDDSWYRFDGVIWVSVRDSALVDFISDLTSDDVLTAVEKGILKTEYDSIIAEKNNLVNQFLLYSASTTTLTDYTTAYTALYNHMNVAMSNLSTDTTEVNFCSIMRTRFLSYYEKRSALLNAIEINSKTLADSKAETFYSNTAPYENQLAQTSINTTYEARLKDLWYDIDGGYIDPLTVASGGTILSATRAVTTGICTITTTANHGLLVGNIVEIKDSSASFNGTWKITAIVSQTQFRFQHTSTTSASTGAGGTVKKCGAERATYMYVKTNINSNIPWTSGNIDYKWVLVDIPKDVFDKIDGKKTIYTAKPTGQYFKNDIWIVATVDTQVTVYNSIGTLVDHPTVAGDMLVARQDSAGAIFAATDWKVATKYTDDTELLEFIAGDYAIDKAKWSQKTTQSPTAPLNPLPGDIWIDTSQGNQIKFYNGTGWTLAVDTTKNRTFYDSKNLTLLQPNTTPTPPAITGDLWYNTTDYSWYRYSGSAWASVRDSALVNFINGLASDDTLTSTEKKILKPEYDNIVKEKPEIDKQYDIYFTDRLTLTSVGYNYNVAYNDLFNHMSTAMASLTTDTSGTAFCTNMRNYFSNYYDKRAILLTAIGNGSKSLVDGKAETFYSNTAYTNVIFPILPDSTTEGKLNDLWYDIDGGYLDPLAISISITNATRQVTTGICTVVTSSNHNLSVGNNISITSMPSPFTSFNSSWVVTEIVSLTSFKFVHTATTAITNQATTGVVRKLGSAGTTYRYTKTNAGTNIPWTSGNADYKWLPFEVPKEVFDKIDSKKTIFTSKPIGQYFKDDVWIVSPVDSYSITNVARAGTTCTVTLSAPHGYIIGNTITISGCSNSTFNGTWIVASTPTTSSFTFAHTSSGTINSIAATGSASIVVYGLDGISSHVIVVNELLIAKQNSTGTTFTAGDWRVATKYTDDTNLNNFINDVFSDDRITPDEKAIILREYLLILAEKAGNDIKADTYAEYTEVTTLKSAYGDAYEALRVYLFSLPPNGEALLELVGETYSTTSGTTDVDSVVMLGKFTDYYEAKELLLEKIVEVSKGYVDTKSSTSIKQSSDNILLSILKERHRYVNASQIALAILDDNGDNTFTFNENGKSLLLDLWQGSEMSYTSIISNCANLNINTTTLLNLFSVANTQVVLFESYQVPKTNVTIEQVGVLSNALSNYYIEEARIKDEIGSISSSKINEVASDSFITSSEKLSLRQLKSAIDEEYSQLVANISEINSSTSFKVSISSVSRASTTGVCTIKTGTPHKLSVGNKVTISCSNSNFNGTFDIAVGAITSESSFTVVHEIKTAIAEVNATGHIIETILYQGFLDSYFYLSEYLVNTVQINDNSTSNIDKNVFINRFSTYYEEKDRLVQKINSKTVMQASFVNEKLETYFSFDIDGLRIKSVINGSQGAVYAKLSSDKLSFNSSQSNEEIAYIGSTQLYITNAQVLNEMIIANFKFVSRSGNMSIIHI